MTDPGRLRHRLTLEAPVETPDGAGGVLRTYAAAATVWAELAPVAARGAVAAHARGATVTHRIVIREGPEVTMRHRFRKGGRIFEIVALREREGRLLEIEAEERRP
jgi:SPP1 family predicted phage head-tail adaptor